MAVDFGINLGSMTITTNETTLTERPQVVQAFVNATLHGRLEAAKDRTAGIDALMNNVSDLERAVAEESWNMLADRLIGLKEVTKERPYGYNDPDLFRTTAEILQKYRPLKKIPPLAEVFDNRFVGAYHWSVW